MRTFKSPYEASLVEELLAEFNEQLRCTGAADFGLLERCPSGSRKELRALMNVAVLAYRALEPERSAKKGPVAKAAS